ncbi:hypothetical protein ThvES_00007650 [Thiovulum sp. ES]|nr:hypothetical protein ThvES_00007650 [Thiovulum sp. ES]
MLNFGSSFKKLVQDSGIEIIERITIKTANGEKRIKLGGSQEENQVIANALSKNLSADEVRILEKSGVEIEFTNENGCALYSEDLIRTDNGLFYKGRRVLLHIAQRTSVKKNSPDNLPKYHLHYCKALEMQKNNGNLEKYRVSLSQDGTFHFSFGDKFISDQKLHVCKTCVKELYPNYKEMGVSDERKFYKGEYRNTLNVSYFSLKKHFQTRPETVIDGDSPKLVFDGLDVSGMDMDYQEVSNEYRKEWRKISIERKKAQNYTCQECNWKPRNANEKKYIHTHHMDKNKGNNLSSNLKVLCMECHYNNHPTLKEKQPYKDFLKIK